MKKQTEALELMFKTFNEEIFKGELSPTTITIQSRGKINAMGWFTVNKVWLDSNGQEYHEINISAENLNLGTHEIASILLHTMIHYYAKLNNISDTSRNGRYHNRNFKDLAEKFGLDVKEAGTFGYSDTSLRVDTKVLVTRLDIDEDIFKIKRITAGKKKTKQSLRKYICPECGLTVRATKDDIRILCIECSEELYQERNEEDA